MTRTCSEPECESTVVARGLCSTHYQRYRHRGHLDQVAPPPTNRTCGHCQQPFNTKLRRWGAIYCSKRCNDNARHARAREARGRSAQTCAHCGTSLEYKRIDARFCSAACSQNWRNHQISQSNRTTKLATRRPCTGCGGPIPAERRGNASYCSNECKLQSRRHEAYGLTKQDLEVLLAQHDQCAICATDEWGRKGPQVDHCHATGRVRGVLCVNCNNGLGRFRDRIDLLEAAIVYLRQ